MGTDDAPSACRGDALLPCYSRRSALERTHPAVPTAEVTPDTHDGPQPRSRVCALVFRGAGPPPAAAAATYAT